VTDTNGVSYSITANSSNNEELRHQILGLSRKRGSRYSGNIGFATYNSFQATLSRRLNRGLYFQAAYTWSHEIDNVSGSLSTDELNATRNGQGGANILNDQSNAQQNKATGDFDRRHRLVVSYSYDLPVLKNGFMNNQFFKGWSISGIITYQSGLPFSVTIGGDSLGMKSQNTFNLPDRLNTPECRNPVNPGNPDHYIKVECFVAPNPGSARVPPTEAPRLGNAGRNSFTGPGLVNVDMSLNKSNYIRSISETFNVQFRVDVFNVLNHPNFRPPTGAAGQVFNASYVPNSSAVVGRLTSTSTTSRQIQLAVKFIW